MRVDIDRVGRDKLSYGHEDPYRAYVRELVDCHNQLVDSFNELVKADKPDQLIVTNNCDDLYDSLGFFQERLEEVERELEVVDSMYSRRFHQVDNRRRKERPLWLPFSIVLGLIWPFICFWLMSHEIWTLG